MGCLWTHRLDRAKARGKMRLLITGAEGQLGRDLLRVLSARHECIGLGKKALDIGKGQDVISALKKYRPDRVLNAAAYTKVDACEKERELAWGLNAEAPKILAAYCEAEAIPLIHFSTDYVFDGKMTPPGAYVETDATQPLSYYGISKLAGEQGIAAATDRYLILRTAWLYGMGGPNFLKTMLRLALSKKPLRVVNDQVGSLTWTYRLAQQVEKLLEGEHRGIYHATAEGSGTWYEAARFFLEKMEVDFVMEPCTAADYPTPAVRPKNSILENQRLKREGLNVMADWKKDLEAFVLEFREKLLKEAEGY